MSDLVSALTVIERLNGEIHWLEHADLRYYIKYLFHYLKEKEGNSFF